MTAAAPMASAGLMTDEQFAKLSLAEQTEILTPLRRVADAVGEQGRSAHADVYGSLSIDVTTRSVTLFATDTAQATRLLKDAKAQHPGIDTSLVRVVWGEHTRKELDAARDAIMADVQNKKITYPVFSVSVKADASGLNVATDPTTAATPTAAQAAHAQLREAVKKTQPARAAKSAGTTAQADAGAAAEVPVSLAQGQGQGQGQIKNLTWRWNDSRPFIGGDYVGITNHRCTTSAAAYMGTGDWILTAAHCFPEGQNVYGNASTYGDLRYFTAGNYTGRVTDVHPEWDMEAIYTGTSGGAGSNSDEADQPYGQWYPVIGVQYSYNGDWVCQDGITAYYTGNGVPCGIKVSDEDTTWTSDAYWWDGARHTARGVCGYASGYGADHGDSGALVFTVDGNGRQARGSISGGSDIHHICWTETKDYLKAAGLFLSPYP
ncbi:hypothetical protein [Streptomyces sp. NRRL B-24484]|uniref:hypothetical protein n=1 Tax=Streptomyces sp. NRRL B-24484 TaxID=1463833 RepID=UPI0004C2B11C|nr:hypothetical protein [Streptomyces sp. NRRL B-24484]